MTPRRVGILIGVVALAAAIGLFVNDEPLRSLIGLDLYFGKGQARYEIDLQGKPVLNEHGQRKIVIYSIHAPIHALKAHLITSGILLAVAIGLFVWAARTKSPPSSTATPTN